MSLSKKQIKQEISFRIKSPEKELKDLIHSIIEQPSPKDIEKISSWKKNKSFKGIYDCDSKKIYAWDEKFSDYGDRADLLEIGKWIGFAVINQSLEPRQSRNSDNDIFLDFARKLLALAKKPPLENLFDDLDIKIPSLKKSQKHLKENTEEMSESPVKSTDLEKISSWTKNKSASGVVLFYDGFTRIWLWDANATAPLPRQLKKIDHNNSREDYLSFKIENGEISFPREIKKDKIKDLFQNEKMKKMVVRFNLAMPFDDN